MTQPIIAVENLVLMERTMAQYRKPGEFSDENIEIEIRFKFNKKDFGVPGRTFARLRNDSMKLQPKYSFSDTRDEYFNDVEGRFTTVYGENRVIKEQHHMMKTRLKDFDFPQYYFRVGMSREDIDNLSRPNEPASLIRDKKRWSFSLANNNYRLDLTEVTSFKPPNYRDGETIYEVELEIVQNKLENLRTLDTMVKIILGRMLGTRILYDAQERSELIDRINTYLASITRIKDEIDIGPLAQVRNLKFHDMVQEGLLPTKTRDIRYTATIKADGIRRLLVIDPMGVYLVYPPGDVNKIFGAQQANELAQWHGTVMEGELIPSDRLSKDAPEHYREAKLRIHLYDTICIAGSTEIRKFPHMTRLEYIDKLLPVFSKLANNGYLFYRKEFLKFQTAPEFYQQINLALDSTYPFLTDGLIFTPDNYGYDNESNQKTPDLTKNPDLVKWKPPQKITIDFQIRHVVDSSGNYVELLAIQKGELIPFTALNFNTRNNVELNDLVRTAPNGSIIEFEWVGGKFRGIGIRYDKITPNSIRVARDNWKDIHDPIEEKVIRGRVFKLVYKHHNRIKKSLFQYVGEQTALSAIPGAGRTLLDIGSGRGGDVSKWKDAGFTHVIAVEPDEENRKSLVSRLEALNQQETDPSKRLQYRILPVGGQDTAEIIRVVREFAPKKRVDVISYMLSLSFFFKNVEMLNSIRVLASETLDRGGHFIAFTVDGRPLWQLFQTPGYYTEVNQIRKANMKMIDLELRPPNDTEKSYHVFINIPESIVTNQIEYLTNLPELEKMFTQIGISKIREEQATGQDFLTQEESLFTYLYTSLVYVKN